MGKQKISAESIERNKMNNLGSVDEILDFAMEREQEASDFYVEMAQKVKGDSMRRTFLTFSREELGHKAKLQAIKDNKALMGGERKVLDLKLADYLVDVQPAADLEYADALILAMKREKASYRLYTDLAATTDNPELEATLLGLAQEEAKHKLRFEVEYDEHVMTEN
jgi:rubrerythrin